MRILSGIQPTGELHIGNYLGATQRIVRLFDTNECLYMLADLHALTIPQKPGELSRATLQKMAELLAVGFDPEKCILFVQSHVKEHTELAWIFNTLASIGELERMTQFKEKSKQHKKNVNMGLLDYPVLQAADILLYQAEGVPVGRDQKQHLELTRDLARKFNVTYGHTFAEPEPLIPKEQEGAKIMSLVDPKKKMSKSDPDKNSRISPFEDPASIRRKIMRATTDAGKEVSYSPAKKPGISNLLVLYSLFAEEPISSVEKKFAGKGYAPFKKALADLLVDKLEPLRVKKQVLEKREPYLRELLARGAKRARSLAEQTMEEVRSKIGLLHAETL